MAAEASSGFEDGTTREDPEWSWWVWPSEVAGYAAWARLDAVEAGAAVAALQRTVEAFPLRHPNNRYLWLARFLGATQEAGAWSDAETVIDQVLPLIGSAIPCASIPRGRAQAGANSPSSTARAVT